MYNLIRPLLFSLPPEQAHALTLGLLDYLPAACLKQASTNTPIEAMGITFPHRIGLAAGLDKNGEHIAALAKCGFSFIEVGTVTPVAQSGNPKPRLFRLKEASALINRMGFNNLGVDNLVANLSKTLYRGILGINIGKNKDTPLARAHADYIYCLEKVYPFASYVTMNLSSPNTPELRQLQQGEYLSFLLQEVVAVQQILSDKYQRLVPLVIKISPDEEEETVKQVAEAALKYKLGGIIASNTTCSRAGVAGLRHANETGGLSGAPLFNRSTASLCLLKQLVGNAVTLIGVGGIHSVATGVEKIQQGATLLQLYTGLIYQGPQLVYDLARAKYSE